jgi:CTP:molybdopterin cytidylyltransferase MocA
MGRDKALLPWRGRTFLTGSIDLLCQETDFVVVVAGGNSIKLSPLINAAGASMVVNPDPSRGQFSSLRIGLQEVLNRGRDAAVVALVDRPPVQSSTLAALRRAFDDALARDKWAVIPEHQGRHGHPIVVGREMMEAFLRAPAGSNAREVEHAHAQRIEYLTVADPFVTANVDTPEDYDRLTQPSSPVEPR